MNENKTSILITDDDEDICELVSQLLIRNNFNCTTARNGTEMFARLAEKQIDLILLDVMLPGRDGIDLCRQLRSDPGMPPVIMLTARDEEIDRVVGLEVGADDYVVKPFGSRELIARIKTVLRRVRYQPSGASIGTYCFGQWQYNPARMELIDQELTVTVLSSSENDILLALVQNPMIPLSRDRLLSLTKGRNSSAFDRSIDSHISRLRRKLKDDAKSPEIIRTAWGAGYIFSHNVDVQ
ncbi:response regulator [Neptunicella marina]|uniref:Response regulator transcription factor n=1 Tax=Neptunicella marina TaxID=2125989 RepID=A0A8J6IU64_9ALTE|nr:response regulator transcription factor [Neptunicella marina]MBC3765508.1 response regulator transcription factor [Neptunicella marina]